MLVKFWYFVLSSEVICIWLKNFLEVVCVILHVVFAAEHCKLLCLIHTILLRLLVLLNDLGQNKCVISINSVVLCIEQQ